MFFVVGPWRNRGWGDLNVSFCPRSLVKQGLARFQCLFLCLVRRETGVGGLILYSVRRETGVGPIRMNCFRRRSGVKQGFGAIPLSHFVFGPA